MADGWSIAVLVVVALVGLAVGVALGRRTRPPAAADDALEAAEGPRRGGRAVDNLPRALWDLPLGIVVAEADGRVVYRNAVADHFTEARHGEALVEAAVQDLLRSRVSVHTERVVDLYGPPRRNMVVKASPMTVAGAATGTLVIIEDASEQQRVHAVRRDFVANVSHELKTPVGAIGVLAETLQGEDDPAVVARLTGRLQAEAIRLGNTVDDLLALSRIESGERFEPTRLDLRDIVGAAVDRNANPAERRDVTLTVQPSEHPVVVEGDERQLVSAVSNLVNNAITYSDRGSRVTVGISCSPDEAAIDVRDRGVGIPARDLERVFERFYRVDPARSRNTGGTGLGLSIVRHVALNHGGEVTVRSIEGRGSTFTLHLPLQPGGGAAAAASPSAPPSRAVPTARLATNQE